MDVQNIALCGRAASENGADNRPGRCVRMSVPGPACVKTDSLAESRGDDEGLR